MGLFFAWVIGESVVFYRWGKLGAPPTPGVLVQSSALFAGLALISLYQPARTFATVTEAALTCTAELAVTVTLLGVTWMLEPPTVTVKESLVSVSTIVLPCGVATVIDEALSSKIIFVPPRVRMT